MGVHLENFGYFRMMLKGFLIVIGIIVALLVGIFLIKAPQFAPPPPFVMPPETVTSREAEEMIWENVVTAVGTLRASQGVMVSAEVSGTVSAIHFDSGESVETGDLLFELDTSTERAQLESAKATHELAEVNLKRAQELRESRSIAESELDTADARAKETKAAMEQVRATLEKKIIRAPFAGRLGIRQVDVGEYLNPGAVVVSLQSINPVYVDFSLPQQQVTKVKNGYAFRLEMDTYPDRSFEGVVEAIDPDLDLSNRMFRVRGVLVNEDGALRPGMFANVGIVQPEASAVVAVPGAAVYYQAYGNTIFVVKPGESGNFVEQRFVKLGRTKGDFVSVLNSLEVGEEVVTAGAFKLSNGRSVVIDNSKALEVSLNPKPADS
jgi:membrane fusion protein (multidrug efflux system)